MEKRSKFQQKAIRNYYDNREAIALQRLQELVTELYLSEGKQRSRHWKHVATHLAALDVKQEQIDHLISQDNPTLVANLIKDFMDKKS
jgi:hypothetical protein